MTTQMTIEVMTMTMKMMNIEGEDLQRAAMSHENENDIGGENGKADQDALMKIGATYKALQ